MRVLSGCMFLCAFLMLSVRAVAADETRRLDIKRIAEVNAEFDNRLGTNCGEIAVVFNGRPGNKMSVEPIFSWNPRRDFEFGPISKKTGLPKLTGLGIRRVYLRSNFIPAAIVERIQDIESPLALLRIEGQLVENQHIEHILSGMKADIQNLEIECPKVTPEVLDTIDLKRIGDILVVGRRGQMKEFHAFVDKLISEKKLRPQQRIVMAPLLDTSFTPPIQNEKRAKEKPDGQTYGQLTVTENLIRQEVVRLGGDWESGRKPQYIAFLGDKFKSRHFEMLMHLPSVTFFHAEDCPVDAFALACLSQVSQLERLDIERCKLESECLSLLRRNRELNKIYLIDIVLSDKLIAELGALKQLETINFIDCEGLTDERLSALKVKLPDVTIK